MSVGREVSEGADRKGLLGEGRRTARKKSEISWVM